MTINPIGNDQFMVQVGRSQDVMTLDEVMFLLSQPPKVVPKQEPSQAELEEFWERSNSFCGEMGALD